MKRPDGYDRPAPRRAPKPSAVPADERAADGPSDDDATAAPPLPDGPMPWWLEKRTPDAERPAESDDRAWGALASAPAPPASARSAVESPAAPSESSLTAAVPFAPVRTATPAPASEHPSTLRDARAALRRARRERVRYERTEVRRFTAAARKRRSRVLLVLVVVASLAVLVVAGSYSPLMALRTVSVQGTDRLASSDLVAAVDGQVGTPLPLLDRAEIEAELATFPLIQSYSLEVRPPSTLVIDVVERVPVLAVSTGSGYASVDQAGVTVATTKKRPRRMPVGAGLVVSEDDTAFRAVTRMLAASPDAVTKRIDTVTARSADDITLTLRKSGTTVVWGSAAHSTLKARILDDMLTAKRSKNASYYDVSSTESPVYR